MSEPSVNPAPESAPAPASAGKATSKSLAMRRRILVGIAVTCFLLITIIAIQLYRKIIDEHGGIEINVPAEMQLHIDRAKVAQQEIFNIEQKVWKDKGTLTPDDLQAIRERRKALEGARKGLEDLIKLVCDKVENGRASSDVREMGLKLLSIKLWILDADDVVEKPAPPEGPGGFYIPLHTTIDAWRSVQREVQNISKTKGEILQRNDAEEKKRARATLQDCFGVLPRAAQAFSDLDAYVRKKLDREDLTSDQLPDLGTIEDEAALVGQTILMARGLKAELPE